MSGPARGPVRALLDPGGWVLVAILGVSVLAWSLLAWQWLRLRAERRRGWSWLERAAAPLPDGGGDEDAAGSRAGSRERSLASWSRRAFEARVRPFLRWQEAVLERPLGIIGMLAAAMPLLGLLGTVLGILQTFDALGARGRGEAGALAEGISTALVTTQAGLLLALPVVLAHRLLASRIRRHLEAGSVMLQRLETAYCGD